MNEQIRKLAQGAVRDHLSDPRNIAEVVEAGEYLSEADLDVDENVDDFYEAIENELSWLQQIMADAARCGPREHL